MASVQPARHLLAERSITIREAAEAIGVSYAHLANSLKGLSHPMEAVKTGLPEFLGVTLEECFTAEAVATPYGGPRGRRPKAVQS